MKRLLVSLLTVFSVVIFFYSCKKNTSLEFQKIDYTRVICSVLTNDSSRGCCKVDIQFLYPTAGVEPAILKKIQQQLMIYAFDSSYVKYDAQTAVDSFKSVTFAAYSKLIKDADTISIAKLKSEEWTMNTVILYDSLGILSYELNKYSKVGDVETDHIQYLVFNLKTGDKISQNDIFEEGFEPKVADLLKQQIMIDNDFKSEEQMINGGFFYAMNILPNDNFNVTEEGISYIFNPYEIAVLGFGQVEVLLPFEKLKSVLKEKSPIAKLLKK